MSNIRTDSSSFYLSGVHIKGYKSIDDLKIELANGINILIGKNGSGKSNFLECIHQAFSSPPPSKILFKNVKLELKSPDNHFIVWESEKEFQKEGIGQNIEKENIENRIRTREYLMVDGKDVFSNPIIKGDRHFFKYGNKEILLRNNVRNILARMGPSSVVPLFIRFHIPTHLDCIDIPGTLQIGLEDGLDTWSYLNTLRFLMHLFFDVEISYESDLSKIEKITKESLLKKLKIDKKIIKNIASYTPIEDIRFNSNINIYKNNKTLIIENLKLDFKLNNNWIPWSQLSDGTKRLFYLITEIVDRDNGIILIDEPELGVHPHQFNLIMDFLKQESYTKQIIISTHSPQALNHLSPDELSRILATSYDTEKGTQIKHLTSGQTKKAKQYMKEVGFMSDYWMHSDLEA